MGPRAWKTASTEKFENVYCLLPTGFIIQQEVQSPYRTGRQPNKRLKGGCVVGQKACVVFLEWISRRYREAPRVRRTPIREAFRPKTRPKPNWDLPLGSTISDHMICIYSRLPRRSHQAPWSSEPSGLGPCL